MTRGTIHCINKNNTISYSTQFNGGMYLSERGYEVINKLEDLKDENEFEELVNNFNKEIFKYPEKKLVYKVSFKGNGIKAKSGDKISDPTHADYTYWKNLSGKVVTFIDEEKNKLILEHKGIAVFNFGSRYLKMYPSTGE